MSEARTFYVGGEWRSSGEKVGKCNPYDGSVLAEVCQAGKKDADEAVARALKGFEETRRLPSYKRAEILFSIADRIHTEREKLAQLISTEVGKAIQFSLVEVDRAVTTFQLAGEEAKRIGGEVLPLDLNSASLDRFGITRRFPIGIVLAVCPFNYPLNLAAHKIGPAIASGNAWILKPPPQAPLTGLELARIVESSGYPAAAFSVLPCSNAVAEKLVEDPRIGMLSFTGSAAVGWQLKTKAGKKKVLLELGGNAGVIIDKSANVEYAVKKNVLGSFVYSGQVCIKVQRIFVHESLFDSYVDRFVQAVRELQVGDPMKKETVVGPLIDSAAAERVESWIKEATNQGAKLLIGGRRKGSVVEPTVLIESGRETNVYCSEIFGPVVTIHRFQDFAQAVKDVNDSRFGLQAGVFSNDFANILHAYKHIETGAVIVNDNPTYRIDHMPYGGIKDSGFGREGLKYAIEAMTEPKLLVIGT